MVDYFLLQINKKLMQAMDEKLIITNSDLRGFFFRSDGLLP